MASAPSATLRCNAPTPQTLGQEQHRAPYTHVSLSRNRITSVKVADLWLSVIPEAGLRLGIEVELRVAPLQ